MSARGARLALLLAAAWIASPRAVLAQDSALADLGWIAGAWVIDRVGEEEVEVEGEAERERLEEWWSAPIGNSMVGHFRWVRDGELWITEMLSIRDEPSGVVFRLRHFGGDMTPWEAPDDALTYRLSERGAGRAVFTIVEPRAGRPDRFVYQALPGDSLLVRLEGEGEDGDGTSVQEFRYGRGPSASVGNLRRR